ncbi:MAG TPA: YbjN domain-containing protein [Pseudomonadota bacterium]|nr:YbjN domain-containing protein [Pseudomonadota bacterium]
MSLRFALTYPTLKSWADRLGVPYRFNEEVGQIAVLTRVMDTDVPLVFIPRPDRGMVTMAITLPFATPSERFTAVGESLTILNARSYMGAWILNTDKGEVYFRITLPAMELEYSDETLRFFASLVVSSAEAMAKLLYAVAHKGEGPQSIARAQS